MGRAAYDEESCDNKRGQNAGESSHVKAPSAVGTQRPVEPLLFDEAQGADCQLEIRGSTPDRRHDSEDDPTWDVAGVVQTIVQCNRDS